MPTSTFYNLPEPKRQKLLDAIREELMRVPYEEASINKIIQNACIPRGSFYQYFEDKADMIRLMLEDFKAKIDSFSRQSLMRHGGDPFAMMQECFHLVCGISEQADLCVLYHNLLVGMKVKDDRAEHLPFCRNRADDLDLLRYVDLSLLDLRGQEDLDDCADILASQFKWAVVELLSAPEKKEIIAKRFENKLAILRRGMAAGKEAPECSRSSV